MNILVYAGSLAHTQAGAAHATLDFTNALASTTSHAVYLYATEIDPGTLHPAVRLIPYTAPGKLPGVWRIRHLTEVQQHVLQLRKASLPEVDLCYAQGLVWAMAYRRYRPAVPIITHTGAVISERERIEEHGGVNSPLHVRVDAKILTRMERRSYHEPHWIHVVSTKKVAEQRGAFYGVDSSTFAVAPYGLRPDRFNRQNVNGNARDHLGIPASAVVVLTVSRLTKWKNTDMLLRAFSRTAVNGAYLVVAGDGGERVRLEALAVELGISESVRFTGHVADPAPLYAAADVFALPSQIESFGVVYGEAMLMGLPCIGLRNAPPTVLSSAEDVIGEGETGYCVSNEDELSARMTQLLENTELRRTMGAAGMTRARAHYTCDAYVRSILALARTRLGCDC